MFVSQVGPMVITMERPVFNVRLALHEIAHSMVRSFQSVSNSDRSTNAFERIVYISAN